jgi:cysteine desulfurase
MNSRLYLDYCATTPLHPQVRDKMLLALDQCYGNPSSMHWAGREAATLLHEARLQVAKSLACQAEEIIFTSGATEADNLALLGVIMSSLPDRAHLITTAVEHHAILHTAQYLENQGVSVTYLPVDGQGLVDPQAVIEAIRPETALISVMHVNNETGAVQPVGEIGRMAREQGILMHSDAVQSMGLLDVQVDNLQVDLLSISAHKIYGPKGSGALYVRRGTPLAPLLHGGVQETGLRPGTENIPGILGLGEAAALTLAKKGEERPRLAALRNRLAEGLHERIPGLVINRPSAAWAPHVVSASFPGADAEAMLLHLTRQGVAASMGSACTAKSIEPSHVLTAMGLSAAQIQGTLRLSLGYFTTEEEITRFLSLICDVYERSCSG